MPLSPWVLAGWLAGWLVGCVCVFWCASRINSLEAQLNDCQRLVDIGKTQIVKLSSLLAETSIKGSS